MRWAKPETEAGKRTICPFCGMGCTLLVKPGTGAPFFDEAASYALDFDFAGVSNRGSLCAKGNMSLELLTHPKRFEAPFLREDGVLKPASWDGALKAVVEGLRCIRDEEGPETIGIMIGPWLTIEEVRLAARLAKALGTGNLDSCQPEDRAMGVGISLSGAHPAQIGSVAQIEAMTAMFVVGDLFTMAPCMAKPILEARYKRRQNLLGVLDSSVSRTGWFGKPMLRCRPGRETAALACLLKMALARDPRPDLPWTPAALRCFERIAVEDLAASAGLDPGAAGWLLGALAKEKEKGIFYASGIGGREGEVLAAGLSALLAEATGSRFLGMPVGPNAIGVRRVLTEEGFPARDGLTAAEMIEAGVTGDLKALFVLGGDPMAAFPGTQPHTAAKNLEFLAVAAPMPGETTDHAHLVLPTAVWGEKAGTVLNAFLTETVLEPVLPPPGAARPETAILTAILAGIGERPPDEKSPEEAASAVPTHDFFEEVELFFRLERRGKGSPEAGTHLLLTRNLPAHAGDGWLTRHLSWPRHEYPVPNLSLTPAHALEIGVKDGDPVKVRSRHGESLLYARIETRMPEGTVLAPPHWPGVRSLLPFKLDPVLRELVVGPDRVSVEAAGGNRNG